MKTKALANQSAGFIVKIRNRAFFGTVDFCNVSVGEWVWVAHRDRPVNPTRVKITEIGNAEDVIATSFGDFAHQVQTTHGPMMWHHIFAYKQNALDRFSIKLVDGKRVAQGQDVWMWRSYGLTRGGSIVKKTIAYLDSHRVMCKYANSHIRDIKIYWKV
jgi:hypothetical protein